MGGKVGRIAFRRGGTKSFRSESEVLRSSGSGSCRPDDAFESGDVDAGDLGKMSIGRLCPYL